MEADRSTDTAPLVSVVVPAFDAARWLPRAVGSALAQNLSPLGADTALEVIVVDDASRDDTRAVAERLAAEDPRVRVVANPVNLGPGPARNHGLAEARGTWVAILDADDAYAPGRLAQLISRAEAEGLDVISDLPKLWDIVANSPLPEERQMPADGALVRLDLRGFLEETVPDGGRLDGKVKPVLRRGLVTSGLWRYPEESRVDEDFLLYYEVLRHGVVFGVLHERLYVFSTRFGAISGTWSPASVTPVNYRGVEASSRRLLAAAEAAPGDLGGLALEEVRGFMETRIAKARRMNRSYGWSTLRRGAWRRLGDWLRRDPRNAAVLAGAALDKIADRLGLQRS